MKERIRTFFSNLTKTRVVSYVLFVLSGVILAVAIYMNMSIDVLDNWRLVLPKQEIHAGETIVVQSLYEKKLSVTGKATRYVECENRPGVFVRYPVSEAIANRGAGKTGTGIEILIPDNIPSLPATCKITIVIDYEIAFWRHVIEQNSSATFTLLPEREKSQTEDVSQETSQTEDLMAVQPTLPSSGTGSASSSSSDNTPIVSDNQRDISQGEPVVNSERRLEPTPEQPQPNLIEVVINAVSGLVSGIAGVIA